jgi:hypothetical protein
MRLVLTLILTLPLAAAAACSGSRGQGGRAPGIAQNIAAAQTPMTDTENTPERVAAHSLVTLRKLTSDQTYRDLGFASVGEAEHTTLGEPLRVFFVRLDQLREFTEGDNARRLLTDANRYIFPVLVAGQLRSAVTVELLNGRWEAVGFGGSVIAAEYARVRQLKTMGGSREFIAVQVPAMQLNFLGHGAGGAELLLTPLPSNTDADTDARLFRDDKAIVGFRDTAGHNKSVQSVETLSPQYRTAVTDKKAADIFSRLAPKAKQVRDDVPR